MGSKKSKKEEKKELSLFEETLMWTSYRYCIGRHTYVTTMAYDMAEYYYDKLSDERLAFTAMDIRRSIGDNLRFAPFNVDIDWSIPEKERKPLEFFFEYMIQNDIHSKEELISLDRIEVYRDRDSDDPMKIRYKVVTKNPADNKYISLMDFEDLMPWMDLASFFDKENYKIAVVEFKGKVQEIVVFETYKQEYEDIPEQPGYCKRKEGYWAKQYIAVDEFYKHPRTCGYIVPEYIKEIKEIEN